jgi:hypothetical protein
LSLKINKNIFHLYSMGQKGVPILDRFSSICFLFFPSHDNKNKNRKKRREAVEWEEKGPSSVEIEDRLVGLFWLLPQWMGSFPPTFIGGREWRESKRKGKNMPLLHSFICDCDSFHSPHFSTLEEAKNTIEKPQPMISTFYQFFHSLLMNNGDNRFKN